jgi:hypothetical protein
MSRVPVFDRVYARAHPYEAALKVIFDDKDSPEDRAAARNLSHESRVNPRRKAQLAQCIKARIEKRQARLGGAAGAPKCVGAQPTRQDLAEAVTRYFEHHIRYNPEPDFCAGKFNDKNILKSPGRARRKGAPADEELLVNVFDLGGPISVYLEAANQNGRGNHPDWRSIFDGIDDPGRKPQEWLDEKLGYNPNASAQPLVTTDVQKEFVKAVLEALNANRKGWQPGGPPNPWQPTWAMRWEDFKTATNWIHQGAGNPRSWLEVTGIPKETSGRWIILLVYPVAAVPILARPTILDAGWSACYFPTPPGGLLSSGGHPMDLGKNYRTDGPISEFIHPQIDFDLTFWHKSGYAIGRTDDKVGVDLPGERAAHRLQLMDWYKQTWRADWMINPC